MIYQKDSDFVGDENYLNYRKYDSNDEKKRACDSATSPRILDDIGGGGNRTRVPMWLDGGFYVRRRLICWDESQILGLQPPSH